MDNLLINEYIEKIKDFSNVVLQLDKNYLMFISIVSFLALFLIIYFLVFKKSSSKIDLNKSNLKPSLNDVVNEENEDVIVKNSDNDFVDILVAIEEEMAAVRELYLGGYITKGIYISETDRLYEKAKVFGL